MVDQFADLFRTTDKVKTQQVIKSRDHHCGDIDLVGYLANETDPVSLVLDIRITHDRVGSSTDPNLNGHLKYPNNLDESLNDTVPDKITIPTYLTYSSILRPYGRVFRNSGTLTGTDRCT
jgi:hypothetical protein